MRYWVRKKELHSHTVWDVMDGDEWAGTYRWESDAIHAADALNYEERVEERKEREEVER